VLTLASTTGLCRVEHLYLYFGCIQATLLTDLLQEVGSEKAHFAHALGKLTGFCHSRNFVAVSTRTRNWHLSYIVLTEFTDNQCICLRFVLLLIFHLVLYFSSRHCPLWYHSGRSGLERTLLHVYDWLICVL
jgi:hypothetical protein